MLIFFGGGSTPVGFREPFERTAEMGVKVQV